MTFDEQVRHLAWLFEDLAAQLEVLGVDWWVRQGWSLRRLKQEELDGTGPVENRETSGEDERGSREELRGGGGDAVPGDERERQADRLQALVRQRLKQKRPKAKRRRRRGR